MRHKELRANLAQLVEQLIRNQQVKSSSLLVGSMFRGGVRHARPPFALLQSAPLGVSGGDGAGDAAMGRATGCPFCLFCLCCPVPFRVAIPA